MTTGSALPEVFALLPVSQGIPLLHHLLRQPLHCCNLLSIATQVQPWTASGRCFMFNTASFQDQSAPCALHEEHIASGLFF